MDTLPHPTMLTMENFPDEITRDQGGATKHEKKLLEFNPATRSKMQIDIHLLTVEEYPSQGSPIFHLRDGISSNPHKYESGKLSSSENVRIFSIFRAFLQYLTECCER